MPVHIYLTMNYEKNFKRLARYLPFALRNAFSSAQLPENLQEIHMIAEKPVILHTDLKRYFLKENYKLSDNYRENLISVTKAELEEIFNNICNFSVYSHQSEIVNGFITLAGGNRAGICGTAVKKSGSIYSVRDISSINIRIAREVKECSKPILESIKEIKNGLLICGAPCSGKTTILRDIARKLSYNYKVSLIDTRLELASCRDGIPQFDTGFCDVFSSYDKREGFEQAVRCMSPDFIICDEIGYDDIEALNSAKKSGVSVIASLHCSDKNELNNSFKELKNSGVFSSYVFLKSRENAGQVFEITDGEKLND